MKSKIIKAVAVCIVAAGVGLGGYYVYKTYFTKKTVSSTAQYYMVSSKKMNLEVTVQGTGTAYAAVTKDVAPNNNGTISGLTVKVGDTVTAGQKIFVSNSDELSRSVTTAKNNLAKQELTLSSDQSAAKVDENKIAMDKLSVSDAETQLSNAYSQLNNMTVKAPISGVVTAVNNINGDSVQTGKAVLTIVDMSSIKIKVSVDELDISKINVGQSAAVTFDAVKGKTYEGTVETIGQTGNTSNNVTTYDVVVNIKDPSGIKLGMNGKVIISVEKKDNALVVPAEAVIENNGQKFVRIENTDGTTSNSPNGSQAAASNSQSQSYNGQTNRGSRMQGTISSGRLTAVKTGLETENYIEITEGLTEGQKVLVQLPQTSSTTNSSSNRNNMGGGFGMEMGGNFGGNMNRPSFQGGNGNSQKN